MISSKYNIALIILSSLTYFVFSVSPSKAKTFVPKDRVMSIKEFINAINNDKFLKERNFTTLDSPLSEDEIDLIEIARLNQKKDYGGVAQPGREINKFKGSTLLVGGGKTAGNCGENDGKTILLDFHIENREIDELVNKLGSREWISDPYTGKKFESEDEKKLYISKLKEKKILYKEAFREKNNDFLRRYYTLNIEDKISPDMIASITSKSDMGEIPNHKFLKVEFENVPCDVFLNPTLYPILERITKPEGVITFSISHVCRRLIVPVIRSTKFGTQFIKILKKEMYDNSENMDTDYGSCEISVKNKP